MNGWEVHIFLTTSCTCLDNVGPVVAMVWEGKNAVVTGRKMLGATNPADSAPGTIRGDFAIETGMLAQHVTLFTI